MKNHPQDHSIAELAKEKGNVAFKAKDYATARSLYSHAVASDQSNYLYPLNRSFANLKLDSTQTYPLNSVAPAPAPVLGFTSASSPTLPGLASMPPRSLSVNDQEHHAERLHPSATGLLSRASESGDDLAVGHADASGGEIGFGSGPEDDDAVGAAAGKVDGGSRSASEESNDGTGESQRVSRSADKLVEAQVDKPPLSPPESRNPDTVDIVDRSSTTNQRLPVIQDVDANASADIHSPKTETDTDMPSPSTGALDPPM
ncbi:hypothetical protein EI94DRAFT_1805745 [Lactarius quietus]|nr:hypothetical protein EI94DRAFT_1805745 [Lactarius quietus]